MLINGYKICENLWYSIRVNLWEKLPKKSLAPPLGSVSNTKTVIQKKIMKQFLIVTLLSACLFGCKKNKNCDPVICDIQQTYLLNATKVTIPNGIWGTVSSMEGNCMPGFPPPTNTCTHCPAKRTVKIYAYTTTSQATPDPGSPVFFNSFSTPLIAQVNAEDDGFFQINIPAGNYTVVVVENGKLYASQTDGQGGLNPVTFNGGLLKKDLVMTYKAAF